MARVREKNEPLSAVPPLLFSLLFTIATAKDIKTPTGQSVSENAVKESIPSGLRSNPEEHVLGLDARKNLMVGQGGFTLPLASLQERRVVPASLKTLFMENGEHVDPSSAQPEVYRMSSDEFIDTYRGDTLLGIDGPETLIRPVNLEAYPGVYVYTFDPNAKVKDADIDPILTVPDGDVLDETVLAARNANFTMNKVAALQTCGGNTKHWVELAVAFDNSLCAIYGNSYTDTVSALRSMVDEANGAYAKGTCVEIFITHFDGFCNSSDDPYGFRRADARRHSS